MKPNKVIWSTKPERPWNPITGEEFGAQHSATINGKLKCIIFSPLKNEPHGTSSVHFYDNKVDISVIYLAGNLFSLEQIKTEVERRLIRH